MSVGRFVHACRMLREAAKEREAERERLLQRQKEQLRASRLHYHRCVCQAIHDVALSLSWADVGAAGQSLAVADGGAVGLAGRRWCSAGCCRGSSSWRRGSSTRTGEAKAGASTLPCRVRLHAWKC